jgi:predicted GH43/DUF377 family glycosyl hydrolase
LAARLTEPILTAEDADRSGYVPNVVYTCGAMHCRRAAADPRTASRTAPIGFATARIDDLLRMMR